LRILGADLIVPDGAGSNLKKLEVSPALTTQCRLVEAV
jgi:hypothetical protein